MHRVGVIVRSMPGGRVHPTKEGVAMRTVEYRIEEIPIDPHGPTHMVQLAERLTEWGKDGWEVASLDLTYHPSYSPAAQPQKAVPVLLEREVGS
jgi:hypothetical protein